MEQNSLTQFFDSIFYVVAEPFYYLFSVEQRVYWLYLAMAAVLAAWVFIHLPPKFVDKSSGTKQSRLVLFFNFCFPKKVYFHKSARVDYLFFLINRIAFPWLIAPLMIGAMAMSNLSKSLWAGVPLLPGLLGEADTSDKIFFTLVLLIAMDGAIYLAHYLQHHVAPLWEFHKVHHSAEVLTPVTVYRMHPIDDLLTGSIAGITMGLIIGLFQTLYQEGISWYVVGSLNVGLLAFYLLGYNLRHSHIWLSYNPKISHIFISPAQHQIHHSSHPTHFSKNLGFIFAFWDWIFGTLYVPIKHETIRYGVANENPDKFNAIWKLYLLPFWEIGNSLKSIRRKSRIDQ